MRFGPTARYPRASIQSSHILLEILHPAAGLRGSLTLPLTHAHTCTHMQDTAKLRSVVWGCVLSLRSWVASVRASSLTLRKGRTAATFPNKSIGGVELQERGCRIHYWGQNWKQHHAFQSHNVQLQIFHMFSGHSLQIFDLYFPSVSLCFRCCCGGFPGIVAARLSGLSSERLRGWERRLRENPEMCTCGAGTEPPPPTHTTFSSCQERFITRWWLVQTLIFDPAVVNKLDLWGKCDEFAFILIRIYCCSSGPVEVQWDPFLQEFRNFRYLMMELQLDHNHKSVEFN